jgi:glycosyltransferase involved in cell wall biosynthesis
MKYELAIVMPVYNEEECIVSVVKSWRDMVAGLGIRFRLLVFNDGSKDGTAKALEQFADDDCVEVIHKPNSGHGPTILEGYHRAVQLADWVFQTDSDGEMQPAVFPSLWSKRNEFDALFGCREGRVQGLGRKVISACSRLTVRLFFKGGVKDVNTPYRLIRSDLLRQAVEHIPPDTFAPK